MRLMLVLALLGCLHGTLAHYHRHGGRGQATSEEKEVQRMIEENADSLVTLYNTTVTRIQSLPSADNNEQSPASLKRKNFVKTFLTEYSITLQGPSDSEEEEEETEEEVWCIAKTEAFLRIITFTDMTLRYRMWRNKVLLRSFYKMEDTLENQGYCEPYLRLLNNTEPLLCLINSTYHDMLQLTPASDVASNRTELLAHFIAGFEGYIGAKGLDAPLKSHFHHKRGRHRRSVYPDVPYGNSYTPINSKPAWPQQQVESSNEEDESAESEDGDAESEDGDAESEDGDAEPEDGDAESEDGDAESEERDVESYKTEIWMEADSLSALINTTCTKLASLPPADEDEESQASLDREELVHTFIDEFWEIIKGDSETSEDEEAEEDEDEEWCNFKTEAIITIIKGAHLRLQQLPFMKAAILVPSFLAVERIQEKPGLCVPYFWLVDITEPLLQMINESYHKMLDLPPTGHNRTQFLVDFVEDFKETRRAAQVDDDDNEHQDHHGHHGHHHGHHGHKRGHHGRKHGHHGHKHGHHGHKHGHHGHKHGHHGHKHGHHGHKHGHHGHKHGHHGHGHPERKGGFKWQNNRGDGDEKMGRHREKKEKWWMEHQATGNGDANMDRKDGGLRKKHHFGDKEQGRKELDRNAVKKRRWEETEPTQQRRSGTNGNDGDNGRVDRKGGKDERRKRRKDQKQDTRRDKKRAWTLKKKPNGGDLQQSEHIHLPNSNRGGFQKSEQQSKITWV